jgi:hypothetical protein
VVIGKQVICWPLIEEKKKIYRRFHIMYGHPNCIGIIDGTLLFLTETPEWSGEDFNTRIVGYGLNALFVMNIVMFITIILVGQSQHTITADGETISQI